MFHITTVSTFLQNEGGYRDGLKHQKGRNKGSLHMKYAQSHIYGTCIYWLKDWSAIGVRDEYGVGWPRHMTKIKSCNEPITK